MTVKYPKLWNGASPVGEALVRALQKSSVPYLSSRTGDGVEANKMQWRSEVFVDQGAGGFLSQPARTDGNNIYYIGSSELRLQFKPKMLGRLPKAMPIYVVDGVKSPKYGAVDWQGARPDQVISWDAWSWMGIADKRTNAPSGRTDKFFYDVMHSVVYFLQTNNFFIATSKGDARNFITPTLRYQCVGEGTTVYKNRRIWRKLLDSERLSDKEFIQGAAISSSNDRSGCFIFLRETNSADNGTHDGSIIRAGWLNADGTFDETSRFESNSIGNTVQGWYFNQKANRAICVFLGCEVLEFTHENGFRMIEEWGERWSPYGEPEHPLYNSFMMGRDFFKDEIVKLDIEPAPHPNADFVGRTVKKDAQGNYSPVEWRIPQRRWTQEALEIFASGAPSDKEPHPNFVSRAIGADLRTGMLLCIEATYHPWHGDYQVDWNYEEGTGIAGAGKPVVLSADFVAYEHGVEVLRKTIPM